MTPLLVFLRELPGGLATALAILAFAVKLIFYPLASWANRGVRKNQDIAREIATSVGEIQKSYKGEERAERILALYKESRFNPFLPLRSFGVLFLQIPVFLAIYDSVTSGVFAGESAWIIEDITGQDAVGNILTINFNILPFVMLAIATLSMIHINHLRQLEKHQIITGSILSFSFFLILYQSPAALIFYWSLNIALQWAIDVMLIKKGA